VAYSKIRKYLSRAQAWRRRKTTRPIASVRGGRVITEGVEHNFWADLFHDAMTVSWLGFVGWAAAVFVTLNLVFALTLDLGEAPVANAKGLADLFFFSVETTTTVGYGDMHPQTLFSHAIATVEGFASLFVTASLTGLIFARLSLPRARVLFARNPIVMRRNGAPTLVFRLANARSNLISEATAKVWALTETADQEGRRYIGFRPMRLLKAENPAFVLSWTLFHPIDEESPLFGMSESEIAQSEINFIVSMTGLDETSAQTLHARETFTARDLRFGHEYVDMHSIDEEGVRRVDYSRIHDTRPAPERVAALEKAAE